MPPGFFVFPAYRFVEEEAGMITFFHLDHTRLAQTSVEGDVDVLPPDTLWVDLYCPTREEEKVVEKLLSIEVPTRDEMQEIETSSRLYLEDGALVMTMAVLNKPTSDEPEAASVTFILVGNRLLTVRYVDPVPFNQFIQRIKRQPSLVPSGEQALLGLLEQVSDNLADILESATSDLDGLSRTIFRSNSGAQDSTNFNEAIKIGRAHV